MMFVRYWDFVEGVKSYEEMLWFGGLGALKSFKLRDPRFYR